MPQSSSSEAFSHKRVETEQSDPAALSFIIDQIVNKIQTVTLVKVVAVSNNGGVEPVGTVDVMPLVHQLTGDRKTIEHGVIHNIPYFRLQGGTDAIILDPKVGDIGMCGFCSRDISSVKKNKKASAPPSLRKYDWSDGLYFGGFLNGTPEQYIRFHSGGIHIQTPAKFSVGAGSVDIIASGPVVVQGSTIDLN
jgi:hypothetical protein